MYPECAALLARETPPKVSGNPLKDMLLHLIMVTMHTNRTCKFEPRLEIVPLTQHEKRDLRKIKVT